MYYIFRNVQLKKKVIGPNQVTVVVFIHMYYSIQPIKDWALFIMVAVIVSVDIVLLFAAFEKMLRHAIILSSLLDYKNLLIRM